MSTESKKLVSKNFKKHLINQFIESLSEDDSDKYYLFVGKHDSFTGGDTNIETPNNSVASLVTQSFRNMVFGKKITSNDVKIMVPRHDWVSGTVYTMFDHEDGAIFDKEFYVVVNETANYHVYKCLYNNDGAESTEQPTFIETSASDEIYETADGYQWKYLYSITKTNFDKFATRDYIPIYDNANVSGNAVSGAIDVIKVTAEGQRYNNFYTGQFAVSDIRVGGNTILYSIGNTASAANDFYNDCVITITDGTGKGQYRRITDYRVVGTSKEIVVNSAFGTTPDVTSRYEISPLVVVTGDGEQTINCEARALVNNFAGNSIYRIEILNRGANYKFATAEILVSNVVPVTVNATAKPILSPTGGHGYDIASELGGSILGISVKISNTESNTISTSNDFRTIGIIKDPQFLSVQLTIEDTDGTPGANGTFLDEETVHSYIPKLYVGTVSVNASCTVVTGTSTDFTNVYEANDYFYFTGGTSYQLGVVNSVTNSSHLILKEESIFTNTTANHGTIKILSSGTVQDRSAGAVTLTSVDGEFSVDDRIIGANSYAVAIVANVAINDINKNFETFSQLRKYVGILSSGEFTEDETVFQEDLETANGLFHSIEYDGGIYELYLTNQTGIINTSNTIKGNTSNAVFTITSKYKGDIVEGVGEVLYLENILPITRANTQSETIKILLEF